MSSQWNEFLISNGANINNGSVTDFGDAPGELEVAAHGNIIADLSHLDRLAISGEDAESFLLSQLSNDIRLLDQEHAQFSTYCNPKGRMLGLFLIFRENKHFVLVSDSTIGTSLIPRLKMFVMRSKVEISDYSAQRILIGVSGADADARLSSLIGLSMPDSSCVLRQRDDITVVRVRGAKPRYMVSASPDNMQPIWEALSDSYTAVGRAAWEWLDIESGTPSISAATSEQFIPQMLNLDILEAINFKKGCYPGQEIIARMKYLGKLKQRMFLGHITQSVPVAGEPVFAKSFGEQRAGTVVIARPAPGGGTDALIVAQITPATEESLHLGSHEGPVIKLKPLPYDVPLEA